MVNVTLPQKSTGRILLPKFVAMSFYFENQHRKRCVFKAMWLDACDESAAVLEAGGGLRWKSTVVHAGQSDMREQGKHSIRSAGYIDRHVIVHRSADRGALRFYTIGWFSAGLGAAATASFAALLGAVKEAAFAVVACLFSQQCWLIPCNSSAVICECFCGWIRCCNDKSYRELRHRGGMKEWSKASSTVMI